ncbi:ribonuclease D [Flavisolibacter nicotianae]|uniref:ribonuclease D n=1 Tax=Flavisolibacter nicotianae TaxID=2364882 RepID=UPI0013C45563|nr:ribonuclease D [Flavisolibacter nicotianae]
MQLINQQDTLLQSLQELGRCDTLSFDIEFDNNSYGYGVTLCLVQVATPQVCFVFDGLNSLDLSGLYALFESPDIQKIVHAPGEDLRLLHSLGCFPKNLFDTEVAARLLNYEPTSLTVLLQDKLNFRMDKKQQRSNWLRRPLSPAQVQYAAEDVIWLHPLKAILEAEAAERALLPFVREEQEMLSTIVYPAPAKTNFLKPSDLYTLSPREQYIANELFRYRDELARYMNRPAYQVMSEELVRDLATGTRQPESILREPGVHPRFKNSRFTTQLLKQLEQAGRAATAQNLSPQKQHRPKPTPAQQAAMRKAAEDREKIFVPIKQALEQQYGSHAAKFILSNKMVNSLVNGVITLQELPSYRQALIRNYAAAAGINLDRYATGTGMG